jgi:hypothetical protein
MRRRVFLLGTVLAVSAIALFVVWPTAGIAGGGADSADHALIDQTGGDTSVSCRAVNGSPFLVFGSFRAFGGDVTLRVNFVDGDFVDYPVAQDGTFSFQQAAGTSSGVDTRIRVTSSGGTGSLVGWLSANRAPGSDARVVCNTAAA